MRRHQKLHRRKGAARRPGSPRATSRHTVQAEDQPAWWLRDTAWKSVIAQSHDCLANLAPDTTILYASAVCERLLGYTSDELIGKPGFGVVLPEDRDTLRRSFEHNLNLAGARSIFEVRAQHRDGSWRWLECRTTDLTRAPEIGAVIVNFSDISEPKANDELRWLLTEIVQSTDYAIIGTDLDGSIISWNNAAERIYGYAAQEAIGRSICRLIPEQLREEMTSVRERVFRGQRVEHFETQRRRKEGALIDVGLTIAPLRNRTGAVIGGSAVSYDIAARKQAEAQNEARDTLLRSLLDKLPDGTVNVLDRELRYVLAAGQELRNVGMSPSHSQGRNLREIFPAEQFEFVEPLLRRAFEGETLSFEPEFDGAAYLITATPLLRHDDVVETILVVSQNITERRRAEGERIQLLQREQEARRIAQNALLARDTFLSVAAHELKSPLTSLLGTAQMLERRAARDESIAPKHLSSIRAIVEHSRKLSSMVNTLFDLSRIDSGQLSIKPELVDMSEPARRVVDDERVLHENANIDCKKAGKQLRVWGDQLRPEQVLRNLIQNAFKYSPAGAPVLVRIFCSDERVGINVADRGIGIPPNDIPMLFERFYRASYVARSRSLRMGLGLYVVKEIVSLHGGQIGAESVLDEGTTFTVWLSRASAIPDVHGAQGSERDLAPGGAD